MKAEAHILKAGRFEATIGRLDPEEDYEAIIWASMHVCTHWLNAVFHAKGITPEDIDFEHTFYLEKIPDQESLRASLDDELRGVLKALEVFEGLRTTHVRGPGPYGPAICEMSGEAFERIKAYGQKSVGQA